MPKKVYSKKAPGSVKDRVRETLRDLQARYGEGAIMRLGEAKKVDVDAIPTGVLSLDLALGVGGIPRGRIIEIFGPEMSGKTSVALHIVAEAQKLGGVAAYVDAEHALDPEYSRKIGVNIDDLIISQPDTGEQALNIVEDLVRSKAIDVIVIDSVAALTPQAEIEGKMDDLQVGAQARLMSKALRKLTGIAAQAKTSVIFINQTRMKIGIRFGDPETTPGGKALKFYASVRLRLKRTAKIQKGDTIVGNRIKAKVVKNKVAPPFRETEFDIIYDKGISKLSDLIKTAEKYNLIERKGNWYHFGKKALGHGLDQAQQYLVEHPRVVQDLTSQIKKAVQKERQ